MREEEPQQDRRRERMYKAYERSGNSQFLASALRCISNSLLALYGGAERRGDEEQTIDRAEHCWNNGMMEGLNYNGVLQLNHKWHRIR